MAKKPTFTQQQIRVFCDSIHQGSRKEALDAIEQLKTDASVEVIVSGNDVTVKQDGIERQVTMRPEPSLPA